MPNIKKIQGDLELQVKNLCEKGYNSNYIAKQVGLSKDTIKAWATQNGFELAKKLLLKF